MTTTARTTELLTRRGRHDRATHRAGLGARLGQLVRYGTVSAIATTTSLAVLGALVATRTVTAGWANVIATGVGTVPSFELNRRWVWGRRGDRSLGGEVVPFVAMTAAGLALSTLAVSLAARWADASGLGTSTRTLAVQAANLAAFGSLWLAQFVVLDRFLFAPRPAVGQDARAPSPPR
jgi:putative flippase GtrA